MYWDAWEYARTTGYSQAVSLASAACLELEFTLANSPAITGMVSQHYIAPFWHHCVSTVDIRDYPFAEFRLFQFFGFNPAAFDVSGSTGCKTESDREGGRARQI